MNKQVTMFNIDQLSEFFHRYPIQNIPDIGCFNDFDDTDAYLVAFKYYIEHGVDIMSDYFKIKDTARYLRHLQKTYGGYERYMFSTDDISDEVKYVLSYEGPWEVDKLLSYLGCKKEIFEDFLKEYNSGFEKTYKQNRENREKAHQDYINKYYEAKRIFSKSDMDHYFNIAIKKDMSLKIDKNKIDVSGIKYPIMVFLHSEERIVSIHKVVHNLEASLLNYKRSKKFDNYSYAYVSEDIIDDIVAEAIVRYNPVNLYSSAITINNSIYRTLNQIKQRYKYDKKVDLRIIKKVVDIYEIPIYHLSNGQSIVDKELFDEALKKYVNG